HGQAVDRFPVLLQRRRLAHQGRQRPRVACRGDRRSQRHHQCARAGRHRPTFLGFGDLAAYALVMGAYGVGDVTGNIIAGSVKLKRPMSTMFMGYVAMGSGFSWLALSVWLLPADRLLPAMMLGGLLAGLGGPFFFVPMITRMQTVFHGHDIAHVFRLRLVVMAAGMLVASLLATWCFELMGAVATQLACGLLILAVGVAGHVLCRRVENRERAGAADPSPVPGD